MDMNPSIDIARDIVIICLYESTESYFCDPGMGAGIGITL